MKNSNIILDKLNEIQQEIKTLSDIVTNDNSKVRLGDCEFGSVVDIGVGHKFIVFSKDEDKVGLLCEDFWLENVKFGDSTNYINSNVQKRLNDEVLPVIENAVGKDNIIQERIRLTAIDGINNHGSVDCKVRLLTFDEFRSKSIFTRNEDLNGWWWLMNPWSDNSVNDITVTVVSPRGSIFNFNRDSYRGVRPFVSLSSSIFVSKE